MCFRVWVNACACACMSVPSMDMLTAMEGVSDFGDKVMAMKAAEPLSPISLQPKTCFVLFADEEKQQAESFKKVNFLL